VTCSGRSLAADGRIPLAAGASGGRP
jgi:hypothetical protein